jgi:hypothetical protein
MYQDMPPVKGHNVQMEGAMPAGAIPLTPVGPPEGGRYK